MRINIKTKRDTHKKSTQTTTKLNWLVSGIEDANRAWTTTSHVPVLSGSAAVNAALNRDQLCPCSGDEPGDDPNNGATNTISPKTNTLSLSLYSNIYTLANTAHKQPTEFKSQSIFTSMGVFSGCVEKICRKFPFSMLYMFGNWTHLQRYNARHVGFVNSRSTSAVWLYDGCLGFGWNLI